MVNATKINQFNAKYSKIKKNHWRLGSISWDFSANSIKKTGLNAWVYDFCVDYWAFDSINIINVHKCLMKKYDLKWCLELLKNVYRIIK